MRTSIKLGLVALTSAALLAYAVSAVSARSISISEPNIRATWSSLEFRSEFFTIRCPVTLEGRFHASAVGKTPRNLIGLISAARVNQAACVNGIVAAFNGVENYNGAAAPQTLPWHIMYDSFTGTLPLIATLRLLLGRFRWGARDNGGFCTGQYGKAEDTVLFSWTREVGGAITGIAPVAGANIINLFRNDAGLCPMRAELAGTGQLTALNSITRVRVTLI